MNDSLTLVSEKRLRELLEMEKELEAAREVVEAAQLYIDEINDPSTNTNYKNLRKKLDEARRG